MTTTESRQIHASGPQVPGALRLSENRLAVAVEAGERTPPRPDLAA